MGLRVDCPVLQALAMGPQSPAPAAQAPEHLELAQVPLAQAQAAKVAQARVALFRSKAKVEAAGPVALGGPAVLDTQDHRARRLDRFEPPRLRPEEYTHSPQRLGA